MLFSLPPDLSPASSLVYYVCDNIAKRFDNCISVVFDGHLVVLIHHLSAAESDAPLESPIISNVLLFLDEHMFTSGVSAGFSNILDIKAYYEFATLTVQAGRRLYPERRQYYFSDILPAQIFFPAISALSNPEKMLHPVIPMIREYDAMYNTEHEKTLQAYVRCMFNKKEAVTMLNVHINTLNYRLNQINDLWHIASMSMQEKTYLFCSYVLMDLFGVSRDLGR